MARDLFPQARAQFGAALMKFFKIGKLTFGGGGGQAWKELFSDSRRDYRSAYETNVWAYRGINAIATAGGRIPFKVVQKSSAGALEEVVSHPWTALLENPNPFMTRQDLIELLLIFAESTGTGYILLDDGADQARSLGSSMNLREVKELWPLPSHEMTPIPDAKTFIKGYRFKPVDQGKFSDYSTAEIFRIQYPSPCETLYGMGVLKPVGGDIAADAYAQGFERFIMKNLASNIIFLRTEGRFTSDQEEEYRRSLAKVFKGVQIAFMQSGLDFATPQIAAKDLPFLELDARRQKRILGACGVPPVMAGSEDAKYDNAGEQKKFFWGDTMRPKLNRIAGMMTKKLHELGEKTNLLVIPDLSEIQELKPDQKINAETAKTWHDLGYPLNGLIKTFGVPGMEEQEGGDVGLVSAGLIPIDQVINPPEELDPEGTPEDAPPPGKKPTADEGIDEEAVAAGKKKPTKGMSPAELAKSAISDKALDDAHWKRFIATSEPGFRRLRVAVKQLFRAERKTIIARIEELDLKGVSSIKDPRIALILSNFEAEEGPKLAKLAKPIIRSIYKKLGEQAIGDVGASIAFDISSPRAVEFLTDHVFKFSFDVSRTTRSRLTDILQEKFAEGVSQGDLVKAIQAEFDFAERYRAARIARTESGIAGNNGILEGMIQAGVTEKRWISSRDEKVRETHAVADGQQVGIDEPFDVGGALLDCPGDPNGPPEEIINCRCAVRAARTKE